MATMVSYQKHILNSFAKKNPIFLFLKMREKKHKEFYDKMYNKMKKQGYYLLDKLLNSLEYGVPQERERVIMIGINVRNQKDKDQLKDIVKNFNWGIG